MFLLFNSLNEKREGRVGKGWGEEQKGRGEVSKVEEGRGGKRKGEGRGRKGEEGEGRGRKGEEGEGREGRGGRLSREIGLRIIVAKIPCLSSVYNGLFIQPSISTLYLETGLKMSAQNLCPHPMSEAPSKGVEKNFKFCYFPLYHTHTWATWAASHMMHLHPSSAGS